MCHVGKENPTNAARQPSINIGWVSLLFVVHVPMTEQDEGEIPHTSRQSISRKRALIVTRRRHGSAPSLVGRRPPVPGLQRAVPSHTIRACSHKHKSCCLLSSCVYKCGPVASLNGQQLVFVRIIGTRIFQQFCQPIRTNWADPAPSGPHALVWLAATGGPH